MILFVLSMVSAMEHWLMEKEFYYNLALLKILCSFDVILRHFYHNDSYYINLLTLLAVPCFVITSFFLSAELIKSGDKKKLGKRMIRLIVPMEIWGGFYWFTSDNVGAKDLVWQLTLGRGINSVFWFFSVQIIITVFLYILCHVSDKWGGTDTVMLLVLVLCFFLQYSEINYNLFVDKIDQINGSIGRVVEILPYAIVGIYFAEHKWILDKIKATYIPVVCLIGCIVAMIHIPHCLGMAYQGVKLFVLAILIFILFYAIKIKYNVVIRKMSNYTLGIFCVHVCIGNRLAKLNDNNHNLLLCVAIFIVSLILSFMISKINGKKIVC